MILFVCVCSQRQLLLRGRSAALRREARAVGLDAQGCWCLSVAEPAQRRCSSVLCRSCGMPLQM